MAFANTIEEIDFRCPPDTVTVNKETSMSFNTFAHKLQPEMLELQNELQKYNFASLGEYVVLKHYHSYDTHSGKNNCHVFYLEISNPSKKLKDSYTDDSDHFGLYFEKNEIHKFNRETKKYEPAGWKYTSEICGCLLNSEILPYTPDFQLDDFFDSLDKINKPLTHYVYFRNNQITFDHYYTTNLYPRFDGCPITGFKGIQLNFGSLYFNTEQFFNLYYDFDTMNINLDKSEVVYDCQNVEDPIVKDEVLNAFADNIYLRNEVFETYKFDR